MVVYRIDKNENAYERVVACANLYKHRRYLVVVERESRANFYVKFQIDNYLHPTLADDLTKLNASRVRFSLVKRLVDLSVSEIENLRKEFPLVLLDEAFRIAIPELYCENPRIKSDKYKRLLFDYSVHEHSYINLYKGADELDLSEWGL